MGSPQMTPDRTPEQKREHYEIEKILANRLRNSSKEERRGMYTSVYDELLQRVPHHPRLTRVKAAQDPSTLTAATRYHLNTLAPFIGPNSVFLEIGAGDCAVSLAVAPKVKHVYAVDVSYEITAHVKPPQNFDLLISNGTNIPVPPGSVDVAFSNQLMEHLHPDDAAEQLGEIFQALAPGGKYLCFTPNRLNGPHDISRGYDKQATGMHLREYSVRELDRILKDAGFRRTQIYFPSRHAFAPVSAVAALEACLEALPRGLSYSLASGKALRAVLGIRMVATK
ncbi:MAG TPA: class I SAM-dependent methyltransferase [Steroidobacteraceae bacterium]|nr:class I SAM-dependent methyltransferase [Steroidobacteraceae bacterium]